MELAYKPNRKQDAAHRDPATIRLVTGGWGAGKSYFLIFEALGMALYEGAGGLFCFVRKTHKSIRDSTYEQFRQAIPARMVIAERRDAHNEEVQIIGGSRFWFRGIDDWRKFGSTAFDGILIDEADELTPADFRALRGRLRGPIGPRRMVLVCNPPDHQHWLFEQFVTKGLKDSSVHHLSMLDNAENLPPDYVAQQVANLTPREARRYIHGLWGFIGSGDPVYETSDTLHLGDLQPQRGVALVRGWDFGFRHPCVSFGQALPTAHQNVLDELVLKNTDLPMVVEVVLRKTHERFPGMAVVDYCDIAGQQTDQWGFTAVRYLRAQGIYPRFRKLPLKASIEVVRRQLRTLHQGRPLLMFDRTHCPRTFDAFSGGYAWDVKRDEPAKDPESWYDDIADAVRFWIVPSVPRLASPVLEPLPARVPV